MHMGIYSPLRSGRNDFLLVLYSGIINLSKEFFNANVLGCETQDSGGKHWSLHAAKTFAEETLASACDARLSVAS